MDRPPDLRQLRLSAAARELAQADQPVQALSP